MAIHRLEISNFRGIKSLVWQLVGDTICLIGPGDSTKTTILDSIEYCLSPRWNLQFDDDDFHNGDSSNPIDITITLDAPKELQRAPSQRRTQ